MEDIQALNDKEIEIPATTNDRYSLLSGDIDKWLKKSVSDAKRWVPPNELHDTLRLDLNENQFLNRKEWKALLLDIDWTTIHQYPVYDSLHNALAHENKLSKDFILATNGADQAIEIIIRSLNPSLSTTLLVPTFSYYQHILTLENIDTDKIFYKPDFSVDLKGILDSINIKTSSVLLTSPSNPITLELEKEKLLQILEKARRYNALVVVDEVYSKFCNQDFSSLLDQYDNLVLIRSYSKYHGLASVRLGCILSHPSKIVQFSKIRGPWDISGFGAQIIERVVKSKKWLDFIPDMQTNRKALIESLMARGAKVIPSNVNFITMLHERSDAFADHLKRHGVIIARLRDYPDSGGLLYNALRMSIPNSEQLTKILLLIKEFK